jgi:Spy/CpxP family protein refolding chaperone
MNRVHSCLVAVWLAAVVLVMPAAGMAQEAAKPRSRPPAGTGFATPSFGLPGYWLLGMESTQQELQLTDEQKQQLKTLAEKYQAESRHEWGQLRALSREEQKQKMAEWREKTSQQHAEVRRQVESVLQPVQLTRLKEIQWRTRGPATLSNPRTLEQLSVSEEQQQKLRRLREECQQKTQQLQQEMFHKSLQVLTPEQQAKLKEHVNTQDW